MVNEISCRRSNLDPGNVHTVFLNQITRNVSPFLQRCDFTGFVHRKLIWGIAGSYHKRIIGNVFA